MSKQDRQGVRRPADIERKYNFNKQFSETRAAAEEARRIALDISESDEGLALQVKALDTEVKALDTEVQALDTEVQALDDDINGEGGIKEQLENKIEPDADGNVNLTGSFTGDMIITTPCEYTDSTNETARFPLLRFKDDTSGKDFVLYANGVRWGDGTFKFTKLTFEEAETTGQSE